MRIYRLHEDTIYVTMYENVCSVCTPVAQLFNAIALFQKQNAHEDAIAYRFGTPWARFY